MKVQKKVSIQGDFAKVGEDINDNDIIKILNAGQTISGDYGDRTAFKVETKNGEKLLSFNQTSMNNLIDIYGDETESWKDKDVKVFIVKQMINNKLRNVAYLTGKDCTMNDDGQFICPTSEENKEEIPF